MKHYLFAFLLLASVTAFTAGAVWLALKYPNGFEIFFGIAVFILLYAACYQIVKNFK